MSDRLIASSDQNVPSGALETPYEAPRIETVLTPEEMAREVLYAGNITQDGQAG